MIQPLPELLRDRRFDHDSVVCCFAIRHLLPCLHFFQRVILLLFHCHSILFDIYKFYQFLPPV